jgi:DNA-binding MarR family transcriptional regulator/GNAT superfamily N-acetyltransferase
MIPKPASHTALTNDIAIFRRFNRMYTRFIGTLNEGLLSSDFTLAEARVLYELAARPAPKAKEIAECLGIDPGYLSRLLRKFERAGILKRKASERDGRYEDLALTTRGKSAFKKLNAMTDAHAKSVFEVLPDSARMQLIGCMRSIESILMKPEGKRSYVLRPHRIGDMGWITYREAIGYAKEYGWDGTFESLVAGIVAEFVASFNPDRDRAWIAEMDGQNVGHIFLVKHPEEPHTAKLRLLFVEPSARGTGLGDALVNECIRFARTAGYHKIVLWTQSILVAAHRIYRRAGFRLVREEPHHSFGKDLIGQVWELELT